MRHRLKDIARNFRFDEKMFVSFAVNQANKYGVEFSKVKFSHSTVSTLFADDLVRDFRQHQEAIKVALDPHG